MRRFGYYWKEGLRNIFKHGFMSIAAIAIMVACLILTGTVTLIAYNIDLSIVDLQQSNEIGRLDRRKPHDARGEDPSAAV